MTISTTSKRKRKDQSLGSRGQCCSGQSRETLAHITLQVRGPPPTSGCLHPPPLGVHPRLTPVWSRGRNSQGDQPLLKAPYDPKFQKVQRQKKVGRKSLPLQAFVQPDAAQRLETAPGTRRRDLVTFVTPQGSPVVGEGGCPPLVCP